MGVFIFIRNGFLGRWLIKKMQDVLCVDEGDDSVEVDRAAEVIVYPEYGRNVSWVCEAGCFEEDVVECAAAFHEGFDGHYAGVSGFVSMLVCLRGDIEEKRRLG